jgi:uncharacterized membrane protein
MGLIWEISLGAFLLVTVALGGGAAWLAGRALAIKWRPYWHVVGYMLLFAGAVRFIHYALFGGTLVSPHYYAVDAAVVVLAASLGFRIMRTRQMTSQYRWLYERRGPFFWRRRQPESQISER